MGGDGGLGEDVVLLRHVAEPQSLANGIRVPPCLVGSCRHPGGTHHAPAAAPALPDGFPWGVKRVSWTSWSCSHLTRGCWIQIQPEEPGGGRSEPLCIPAILTALPSAGVAGSALFSAWRPDLVNIHSYFLPPHPPRVTQCKYKRIGCPWQGPYHELTVHEAECTHPTKTGNELMEILDEMDQTRKKEMQLYNSIFSLLSFEKIGYTGNGLLGTAAVASHPFCRVSSSADAVSVLLKPGFILCGD